MSVWVLSRHVDYEGIDEDTIRVFSDKQKCQYVCDTKNKYAKAAQQYDVEWRMREIAVE